MRSAEAVKVIGCSYRQLDYLTRSGAIRGMNSGSGSRRMWPAGTVVRLAIANYVADAIPVVNDGRPFPDIARAALDSTLADPPRRGYAVLAPEPMTMLWAASWADLRRTIDDVGAAVVVRYDLDELVGDDVDLGDLATPSLPR